MADISIVNELIKGSITLIAAGTGAWLSIKFFPIKAKKDERNWQKAIEAENRVFSSLSKIYFLSRHYLHSEYNEKYSMSELGLAETEKEILTIIKGLHKDQFEISIFLNDKQNKVFKTFLEQTQMAMNKAKDLWEDVDQTSSLKIEEHTQRTIASIYALVKKSKSSFEVNCD